jgi:hypothetical protein
MGTYTGALSMRAAIAGMAFLAVAGCASGQNVQVTREQADDAKCRSYGAAKGSPAYVNCRTQLDVQRSNAVAMGDAAAQTGMNTYLIDSYYRMNNNFGR